MFYSMVNVSAVDRGVCGPGALINRDRMARQYRRSAAGESPLQRWNRRNFPPVVYGEAICDNISPNRGAFRLAVYLNAATQQ
jgi:hypothetical protein